MRASARQREIDRWGREGELDEAIAWRRTLPLDDATEDLLDALVGSGHYAATAVQETIAGDAERDTLNRIAVALDRAGKRAPAHDALAAVRSALGRLDARERSEAIRFFEAQTDKPRVSVMSAYELYTGAANRREEQQIERLLGQAQLLPVISEIAKRAGVFVRVYHPSHSVEAIDAVIAATAEHHGLRLATLNIKHFPMFPKLKRAY